MSDLTRHPLLKTKVRIVLIRGHDLRLKQVIADSPDVEVYSEYAADRVGRDRITVDPERVTALLRTIGQRGDG